MKQIIVGLAFAGIVGSMVSALIFMMRGDKSGEDDDSKRAGRMVRALAFRVGISVLLFICVLIAWKFGYLRPTGIPQGA
ncbi:twin transmembrane helix small protein [Ottowia thiooxydans]|uniref:twin transmembrane helix small protein n=1 Tax=Ottowia thiooxydans TaxID=219182 RepID=UPI00041627E9|nr:twin transmembrane helix small protein [Ottowia thiooxydans]